MFCNEWRERIHYQILQTLAHKHCDWFSLSGRVGAFTLQTWLNRHICHIPWKFEVVLSPSQTSVPPMTRPRPFLCSHTSVWWHVSTDWAKSRHTMWSVGEITPSVTDCWSGGPGKRMFPRGPSCAAREDAGFEFSFLICFSFRSRKPWRYSLEYRIR